MSRASQARSGASHARTAGSRPHFSASHASVAGTVRARSHPTPQVARAANRSPHRSAAAAKQRHPSAFRHAPATAGATTTATKLARQSVQGTAPKQEIQKPEIQKPEIQKPEIQKPEIQKPRIQVVQKPKRKFKKLFTLSMICGIAGLIAVPFAILLLHATLLTGQRELDDLRRQVKEQQEINQQLIFNHSLDSSPERIVQIATQELGMVAAEDIIYLAPRE